MGVDNILEKITLDASASAESIVSAAKTEALGIVEEAKKKAADAYSRSIEDAEKEAIESINHIKSMAALESRKMQLAAKREVIDEVFMSAAERFRKLPESRYSAFLAAMANSASENGMLYFSETDAKFAEAVRPLLKGELKIAKNSVRTLQSGFVIKNGNIQINCSVEGLLEDRRSELEPVAVRKLFTK